MSEEKNLGDKLDETKKNIKETAEKAKESVKETAEKAKAEAKEFSEDVKKTAEKAKAEAKEFAKEAKQTAKEFTDNAKETIDAAGDNKKVAAGILALLVGSLGVHKFYLGYNKEGIIQLIGSFVTCGVATIIPFVEGIIYLTKSDEDFYQTYQVGKKPWF